MANTTDTNQATDDTQKAPTRTLSVQHAQHGTATSPIISDTNQVSEVLPEQGGEQLEERLDDISTMGRTQMKREVVELIRNEKLKLLDEVIHQSAVNLKSAKAVAGWAELRKEQLEAEL